MSARHPKNAVGPEFKVTPSQQELPGAPDPYGKALANNAPDPFTQYDARLPGAPAWGAAAGFEATMPGAPDPNTRSYAPQLPDAPDPYAGYAPQLPGAPQMSVQPYEPPAPPPAFDVHSYEPQEPPEYNIVDGFSAHNPHWM